MSNDIRPIGLDYSMWPGTIHRISRSSESTPYKKLIEISKQCTQGDRIDLEGYPIEVISFPDAVEGVGNNYPHRRGYQQPWGTLIFSSISGACLRRADNQPADHWVLRPQPYPPNSTTPSGIVGIEIDGNARNQGTLLCTAYLAEEGEHPYSYQRGISATQLWSVPYVISECHVHDTIGYGIESSANGTSLEIYNTSLIKCRASGIVCTSGGGYLYVKDCSLPTERIEVEFNDGANKIQELSLSVSDTEACQVSLLCPSHFKATFTRLTLSNARLFGGAEDNPILGEDHPEGSTTLTLNDMDLLFFSPKGTVKVVIEPDSDNAEIVTLCAFDENDEFCVTRTTAKLKNPTIRPHENGSEVRCNRLRHHVHHAQQYQPASENVKWIDCDLRGNLRLGDHDYAEYDPGDIYLWRTDNVEFENCQLSEVKIKPIGNKNIWRWPDFYLKLTNCTTPPGVTGIEQLDITNTGIPEELDKIGTVVLCDCNPSYYLPDVKVVTCRSTIINSVVNWVRAIKRWVAEWRS